MIIEGVKMPTFVFDGFTFAVHVNSGSQLAVLYVASKARRGDQEAIALAVATGMRVTGVAGAVYWDDNYLLSNFEYEAGQWLRRAPL